jgi:hypothetical protein
MIIMKIRLVLAISAIKNGISIESFISKNYRKTMEEYKQMIKYLYEKNIVIHFGIVSVVIRVLCVMNV